MTPVQPTLTIAIDQAVYEVAKMSQQVQQMVAYLDDWRQKEVDLSSELLLTRSGIREMQNQLLTGIQQERAEAQKKAEALGLIPAKDCQEQPAANSENSEKGE